MKHSIRSLLGMVAFLVTAVMITLFIMSFVSIPLPGGSVVLSARDYQAIKGGNFRITGGNPFFSKK
jgi:hypothetical protein